MDKISNLYVHSKVAAIAEELQITRAEAQQLVLTALCEQLCSNPNQADNELAQNIVRKLLASLESRSQDVFELFSRLGIKDYSVRLPDSNVIQISEDGIDGPYTLSWTPGTTIIRNGERFIFEKRNVTGVIIPDSVEHIESFGFAWTSISEIKFPTRLTDLTSCVCYKCSDLQRVVLPVGLKTIGSFAFEGCEKLSEINIPDSVETIDSKAFAGCSSLPDDVKARILEIGGPQAFEEDNQEKDEED